MHPETFYIFPQIFWEHERKRGELEREGVKKVLRPDFHHLESGVIYSADTFTVRMQAMFIEMASL